MPTDHRSTARAAAARRMRDLGLTYVLVAKKSGGGITRQSVSSFINGHSWPNDAKLTVIDRALDWPPGTIAGMGIGEPPPGRRRVTEIIWPDDLSEEEIHECEAAVRLESLRVARTIRASRHG